MTAPLEGLTDQYQRDHVRDSPWMRDHCTCREGPNGQRIFTCATNLERNRGRRGLPASCPELGQACMGYCPTCFAAVMANAGVSGLSFDKLSAVNRARAAHWHAGGTPWVGSDWSNAMAGEAGEACNVVKKLRRQETAVVGAADPVWQELVAKLGEELADTLIYIDLVAAHYGVDLPAALCAKFNAVSEREGLEERLP